MTATAAGCRQVVVLGAGLDARAFRLDWPGGVRLFELDRPDVLEFKERVLAARAARARCARVVVSCDLGGDWPPVLTTAGLVTDEPTAWIAEGLLVYLTDEQNEQLLARLSELSLPASRLGLTLAGHGRRAELRRAGRAAMWRSDGPRDPAAWLAAYGWMATFFDPVERAAIYGGPLPRTDKKQPLPTARLVSAERTSPN